MPRNTNAMRVGRDSRGLTSNNSPPDHEFSGEGVSPGECMGGASSLSMSAPLKLREWSGGAC